MDGISNKGKNMKKDEKRKEIKRIQALLDKYNIPLSHIALCLKNKYSISRLNDALKNASTMSDRLLMNINKIISDFQKQNVQFIQQNLF